jgi:hypothetical protein
MLAAAQKRKARYLNPRTTYRSCAATRENGMKSGTNKGEAQSSEIASRTLLSELAASFPSNITTTRTAMPDAREF